MVYENHKKNSSQFWFNNVFESSLVFLKLSVWYSL